MNEGNNYLQEALNIVKAQASVRAMSEEEITAMVQKLAKGIQAIAEPEPTASEAGSTVAIEPKKAITESRITCLECGKTFKILTKKHIASHSLTPEAYREKYGYPKGMPLIAKGLQRERRKKMKDMKLWEKRKKV